ncbi:MAG: AAA family ATPase [Spirochaetaceae bacterium]|nr:AAA family ATPase [Spirochaetaceae bacterium]
MTEVQAQFIKYMPNNGMRNYVLDLYAKTIQLSHQTKPNNWNVCYRKGEKRFQLNCGNKYVLVASAKYILAMCNREDVLSLGEDFVNKLLSKVEFQKEDSTLAKVGLLTPKNFQELEQFPADALWHNTFQFRIAYEDVLEFLPILEKSILHFAEWTTLDRPLLPASKVAHSEEFIDYINQELGLHIPQPVYDSGGPTMPQDKTLVHQYAKLLENTRNLILTGAPGTGKTYLAKQIAEEMGCKPDEIGFVQFHPSYDYTDFVEGLRPVQDESGSGQIGFERKDGVFKEFCARALQNLVDSRKSVDVLQHERSINEIIADFLDGAIEKKTQFETITKNIFFVDSFNDKKIFVSIPQNEKVKNLQIQIDDILELISNHVQLNNGKAVSEYFKRKWRMQHDSYIFSLTKKIQESMENTGNNQTTAVKKIQLKKFVFIIDEINRGEVAKIFGELFYSIDPGYRVTAGDLEAMKAGKKGIVAIRTQYANLELTGNEFDRALGASDYGHFFVPENVYIIGTMNDIDRSVESMDFAFRRRFAWAEVEAIDTVDMLDTLPQVWAEEAKERMKKLNDAISATQDFGPAYHIGASYFLKLNQYEGNFDDLWKYHIKGILEEYVRGHPNKTDLMEKFKAAYFLGKETSSEAEET